MTEETTYFIKLSSGGWAINFEALKNINFTEQQEKEFIKLCEKAKDINELNELVKRLKSND